MLTPQLEDELNVALNEATMLGLEFDPESRRIGLTLSLLALPEGPEPMTEPRVLFLFGNIKRVIVSFRDGAWNDPLARVLPVEPDALLAVCRELGAQAIYGWEFLGGAERALAEWGDRISLDWRAPEAEASTYSFAAFQEGVERHLDFAFWFDTIECRTPSGVPVALDELAAAGRRFWDGVHAGDQRTSESGIVAGKPPMA
jgi:hypothetical protein